VLVLALESSCDETSAALWSPEEGLASLRVLSQDSLHARFGGVVPELASRRHLEVVSPLLREVLEERGGEVGLVAVTRGPGLIGSLLIGLSAAKAFAWARGLPLVGVNHLLAHAIAAHLEHPDLTFPYLALVVSGGHTSLMVIEGYSRRRIIGRTRDDAAGEAYDKIAKLLGLGYPGGPVIDRLAAGGDPSAFPLPRPLRKEPGLDFSFSGLKSAVVRASRDGQIPAERYPDLAASFQAAVVETLVTRVERAVESTGLATVVVAGGVAANRGLRAALAVSASAGGYRLCLPSPRLCVDNAAMVAVAGWGLFQEGGSTTLSLDAFATGQEPS
jgi:N6-L-threonylcarbamoyladenine synthase